MCQWGDSRVVDLSNTTGETAGTILKVWKYGLCFFQGRTLHTGCKVSNKDLES